MTFLSIFGIFILLLFLVIIAFTLSQFCFRYQFFKRLDSLVQQKNLQKMDTTNFLLGFQVTTPSYGFQHFRSFNDFKTSLVYQDSFISNGTKSFNKIFFLTFLSCLYNGSRSCKTNYDSKKMEKNQRN